MPILGNPVVATPSANVVTFNVPKAGIADGDTVAFFIFATDDFNNPPVWPTGFAQISLQGTGPAQYAAHKTIVTAANEPTNWVITADEFTAANKAVCVAWVMPGPFVQSINGAAAAQGALAVREYTLEDIPNVGDGNTVFNISQVNGANRASGVINGGNATVLYENTSGAPDEICFAIAAETVTPAGSSNLGNIVYPNTSVSLLNMSMEFGGSIAAPQNVGWRSTAGFNSAGVSRANETGVRAIVRTEIGATGAPLFDAAVSYDAQGILTLDSNALGSVSDLVDITLIHADGETITFEDATLIDLDA